jgi:hypothetical protein
MRCHTATRTRQKSWRTICHFSTNSTPFSIIQSPNCIFSYYKIVLYCLMKRRRHSGGVLLNTDDVNGPIWNRAPFTHDFPPVRSDIFSRTPRLQAQRRRPGVFVCNRSELAQSQGSQPTAAPVILMGLSTSIVCRRRDSAKVSARMSKKTAKK